MASTIYDIAEKAGVSIATVSRVFSGNAYVSEKTRARVLAVADKFGYHPQAYAQGLASKKTNNIMVIVPIISNYFFMEVLSGIQENLIDSEYDLTIYNVKSDVNYFIQVEHILKKRMADGYLLISIHLKDEDWAKLRKYDAPVVLIDEYNKYFDAVSSDNIEGAYKATKYLADKGFKKIAMLSALETSKPILDRKEGYKKALKEAGIPYDDNLVVRGDIQNRDGFTERGGYETMYRILNELPEVEACFCSSDIQAIGAKKAMLDLNKYIPIIGYDDIEISKYLNLSTIRQPMRDMGYFATQTLLNRLDNPKMEISQTIYNPEIIIRNSTEKSKY